MAGGVDGADVGVGEVNAEGVLLTVSSAPVSVADRARRQATLREQALAALRAAGLR